jgi:hypothetical protein
MGTVDRLPRVVLSTLLTTLLLPQGITTEPPRSVVGEPVRVVAVAVDGRPLAGVVVTLEPVGAAPVAVGTTGADGAVTFVAAEAGALPVAATIDGVRCIVVHRVVDAARPPWAAVLTVPLGLALLWLHLRGRRVDAPAGAGQPSTRSM